MRLHAALSAAEFHPVKHRIAERDDHGIEGVERAARHKNAYRPFSLGILHHEEGEILEDVVVSLLTSDRKRFS